MPACFHTKAGNAEIVLWDITEDENLFIRTLPSCDLDSAARYKNPKRRLEHLACRAGLRHLLPEAGPVSYDANSAPLLEGCPRHIGFSHTGKMAAVIISSQPCAIDVEPVERDFTRASRKFISPDEEHLLSGLPGFLAGIIWCAKEALYKLSGMPGLDFLADIRIISLGPGPDYSNKNISASGIIRAEVRGKPARLRFFIYDGFIVVYTD